MKQGILDKLRGGDLRSIGRSNEVAEDIKKNISHFNEVFNGLHNDDPIVRMRSADVIEKVTQTNPKLLCGHEQEVVAILESAEQQEVCWHIAQIAPRLELSTKEEAKIIKSLKHLLNHKSKIVRVFAMDALATFAERNSSLLNQVIKIIKNQMKDGSPALQARGRKLMQRFEGIQSDG